MNARRPPVETTDEFQGSEACLVIADLNDLQGEDTSGEESARPSDAIVEAQRVEDDDVEEAPDPFDRLQAVESESAADHTLAAAAQSTETTRLGGLIRPLRIVKEAVPLVAPR